MAAISAASFIGELPLILVLLGGLVVAIVLLQRSVGAGLLLGAGCLLLLAELILSVVWARILPSIVEATHIGIAALTPILIVVSLGLAVLGAAALALCIGSVFVGRPGTGHGVTPPSPPRAQPGPPYQYPPPEPPQT